MSAGPELKAQLATLPTETRAELALFLIESLDTGEDADATASWESKLNRRARQIENGEVSGEPAESVMDHLWKKHS